MNANDLRANIVTHIVNNRETYEAELLGADLEIAASRLHGLNLHAARNIRDLPLSDRDTWFERWSADMSRSARGTSDLSGWGTRSTLQAFAQLFDVDVELIRFDIASSRKFFYRRGSSIRQANQFVIGYVHQRVQAQTDNVSSQQIFLYYDGRAHYQSFIRTAAVSNSASVAPPSAPTVI